MNLNSGIHPKSIERLRQSPFASYVDAFVDYLNERRYSKQSVRTYLGCAAHFAQWIRCCRVKIGQIDEERVRRFLDDHLPRCKCARPAARTRADASAALKHLLTVLRANRAIVQRAVDMVPVAVELRCFEEHMKLVRGLARGTRRLALGIVRSFLIEQFARRRIIIARIQPEDVRRFLARQSEHYKVPSSMSSVVSSLRGYFRFRALCGDPVHHLIGVTAYPANWQQASLPKALNATEIRRLLSALGGAGPSARRTHAIVRCAVDLGLRSGEIAKLGLDDIDWHAGTITLRETKGRREDVLPLPVTTGRAIVEYLKFERAPSALRTLFIRRIAPHDLPVGPDLVRKTIRQSYLRAGLPYTGSHLLRHTIASRLLEGGSSLKEVADVLRHRSLNTTLIYAKLDTKNLVGVALPWPGSAS